MAEVCIPARRAISPMVSSFMLFCSLDLKCALNCTLFSKGKASSLGAISTQECSTNHEKSSPLKKGNTMTNPTSASEVIIACNPNAIPTEMREQWVENGKQ